MKKFRVLAILFSLFSLTACEVQELSGEVDFHTDKQNQFWADTNFESSLLAYGSGEESLEKPVPLKIAWNSKKGKKYLIRVSENADMSNAWEFEFSSRKREYDLYNCKTGTNYYYDITTFYSSGQETSEVKTFNTKSGGPRNLYVDGLNNIRDIGGYVTNGNKVVKQGLMYRCAKMNESDVASPQITISEKGIETMTKQLGVKTDIDLRKIEVKDGKSEIGGLTTSPLGESVNYVNCPMYYEGSSVLSHSSKAKRETNQASIKKMFDLMGNINNYPIAFHCTQGKDRTGAMAYLLEALLDMKLDDIYHDYLYTNMSEVGGYCNYSQFAKYDDVLNTFPGTTLQEKASLYLVSIGVSLETITNIQNIFLS